MTLDQLMAFTVSGDWERHEQVWERLASSCKEPYVIRRQLTEGAVRASDKRARFIGETYETEGGTVLRDLFQGDDGGWLQDVALVERLLAERLEREATAIRAEGWRWIKVAADFPYGHQFGLRQLRGEEVPLTETQQAERKALQAEYDRLEEEYVDSDLPEAIERRFEEIEAALAAFDERPEEFDPGDIPAPALSSASAPTAGFPKNPRTTEGTGPCQPQERPTLPNSSTRGACPAPRSPFWFSVSSSLRSTASTQRRSATFPCFCSASKCAEQLLPRLRYFA